MLQEEIHNIKDKTSQSEQGRSLDKAKQRNSGMKILLTGSVHGNAMKTE